MAGLSVFLPWTLFDLVEPALRGGRAFKSVRGSVLFCDVAGFTPLTEALSVIGREGAEELTRLINAYFNTMIGIVEAQGGDVLRFGGDSITCLFPGEARAQALRAAERMMEAMGAFKAMQTRAGIFGLSVKIGASHGDVLLGILGDETLGFDFYAAGPPLDDSAEAEHRAQPGWVVLHPSFLEEGRVDAELSPLPRGCAQLVRVREAPEPLTFGTREPAEESLRRLIPPYLAQRAGEGVLGEHRGTSVLFLSFTGLASGPGAAAEASHERLGHLYRLFARTARRYGGLLNKVDMGDKGSKALVLFGSPYAVERKEEMAVRASGDLLASPALPRGVRLQAGITSAPLFSGPVGGEKRREFTVLGDGINLAARLMQAAAPGQALCDAAVAGKASGSLRFYPLPAIAVKGKREAVAVFTPGGEVEEERERGEVLIGREELCGGLRRYLAEGGTPPCLRGEAGSGKSALIQWCAAEAPALGLPVVRVPLGPYSQDRPFSAWRGPVRSILGLERGDSPQRVKQLRDSALAQEPPGFRPLLNALLDLPEEQGPALRNLSPREKKELTLRILARLIAAAGPRALLLDGLQWADPLSLELLSLVLEERAPTSFRIVAALRPGSAGAESATARMQPADLPPLGPREVRAVLLSVHGLTEVQPEVLEWFAARSKGNPAVVSALVSALEAAGLVQRFEAVTRVDSDRLFTTSFPETLEGLYLARVDHLPRREREVLQAASILGVSVSVNLLREMTGLTREELDAALGGLEAGGLLASDSWGARPYVRFGDTLLREALYGSLPFALKRTGHLKLAEYLEPDGEKNPKAWPVLALHFEQADVQEKAERYHRLAGRAAVSRFDNVTALKHLEYVCALCGTAEDDVEDAFALMDVYGSLGRWADAKPILEKLGAEERGLTPAHQSRLQNYLAQDYSSHGEWEGAEAVLHKGIALAQKAGDVLQESKGYVNLVGRVYGPTGQLDKAKLVLEKALALPESPGQKVVRTTAAMNLGSVFHHQGRLGSAKAAFHRAYYEASKARLGPQQGMIANNLCAVLYESGQFEEAVKWGRRAIRFSEEFAFRGHAQSAKYNLAMAQLATGHAADVQRLLQEVERQARSYGDIQVQAQAAQGLAQASALMGMTEGFFLHGNQALALFQELGNGRDFRFRLLDTGNLFHALDAPEQARGFWQEHDVETFLKNTAPDPVLDRSLERISNWMRGGKAWETGKISFLQEGRDTSPEERLQRLLWVAEAHARRCGHDALVSAVAQVERNLPSWPYFDVKLRFLRLQALLSGGLDEGRIKEARRMLGRCLGGVWGLRLLCLLSRQGCRARSGRRLSNRCLERLAFFEEHSPDWAWKKLSAFPEVRAVLSGSRPHSTL